MLSTSAITPQECSRIAQDLQIRKLQVEAVVQLLDEGNTVPFITRYRKERTGGLDEEVIRHVQTRVQFLRQLHDRKQTILKTIANQGKLTDELRHAIDIADTTKRLEDLYLPYKPKKRSLAIAARDRGLEPLALAIWYSDAAAGNLAEMLPSFLNPEKDLKSVDDVVTGVGHILAEMMAESAEVRAPVRSVLWETGQVLSVKSDKLPDGQGIEFKNYFQFKEAVRQIPPHRILALNRGEKDHALKVSFECDKEVVRNVAARGVAELMLKRAGQMPLPVAPPAAPTPAPEIAPEAVADAVEAAPTDAAAPAESPGAAVPGLPAPAVEASPIPPPAEPMPVPMPLVATMPTTEKPVLTGEQLTPASEFRSPHTTFLKAVLEDALARLLLPSLEREIRHELTDEAEHHAVHVFARNLRSLLLQPPLRGKRVLAIDPGFRTGCKLAALDEFGVLLEHSVMYPFTPPPKKGRRDRGERKEKGDAAKSAETPAVEAVPVAIETQIAAPMPDAMAMPSPTPEATEPVPAATEAIPAEAAAPAESPGTAVPELSVPAVEAPPAPETPPPPPPVDPKIEARAKLIDCVRKHNLQVIALGNGTGCRETEEMIAEVIAADLPDVAYIIVNEAGASVYSVSPVGREEFPTFDATTRGTISIGRRLQDPLSELVKVDPQSIGVGLYQHDMGRKELKDSLDAVVESCVNQVGVDLNTASVPLLRHVSGLNQLVARELVEYRKTHGAFTGREQLMQVPNFGPARYTQAAGFLKIPSGGNPLDRTWIHPESYPAATQLLSDLGYAPTVLDDKAAHEELLTKLKAVPIEDTARKLNVGPPTLYDIIQSLLKPGRDPREDLPPPIFKKGVLKIEDLQPGMELRGTVLNVVDFGAFVDVGLKDSGLVHISQMANRYIKSPYEVVAVNDVVTVWVKSIDAATRHVSLTMIKPGTEQKPPERRPAGNDGGDRRGPRGPRRGPQQQGQQQGQPNEGGQQNQPQQQDNRPPRDNRDNRGPSDRGPRRHDSRPGDRRPQHAGGRSQEPRRDQGPPPPPPPPPKPRRELPKPKLSQEAIEGKVPLRTFRELSALFAAKNEPPKPPEPVKQPNPPAKAEEAKPEPSAESTPTP